MNVVEQCRCNVDLRGFALPLGERRCVGASVHAPPAALLERYGRGNMEEVFLDVARERSAALLPEVAGERSEAGIP